MDDSERKRGIQKKTIIYIDRIQQNLFEWQRNITFSILFHIIHLIR